MNQAELSIKVRLLLALSAPNPNLDLSLQEQLEFAWQLHQLQVLDEILTNAPQETMRADLHEFLKASWELIRGTSLSYMAQPNSLLTELLVDVACFISPANPLNSLMPDLNYTSIVDDEDYPDLNPSTKDQVLNVLKTHILSSDQSYPLPVLLINNLELPPGDNSTIPNPYDPIGSFLSPADIERLKVHSPHTEAIFDAKERYEQTMSSDNSLLNQLNYLCAQLSINAAHGGKGTVANAADGAYPAIIAFNEFYSRLNATQKAQLPPALKTEIEKLLILSSDKDANKIGLDKIDTCLAARKNSLKAAMTVQDTLLASIGLSATHKAAAIYSERIAFVAAKQALRDMLINGTYTGCDKQPITRALLDKLDLQWSIQSEKDVDALRQLNIEEIAELLGDRSLLAGLIGQLPRLDSLVIFIMETREDKLPVFFSALQQYINRMVVTRQHMAALLISLQIDKFATVVRLLKHRIYQKQMLVGLMSHLSPDQRRVLFDIKKTSFIESISGAHKLLKVCKIFCLTRAQFSGILNTIQNRLSGIVNTHEDLFFLIKELHEENLRDLLATLKEHLPNLINNPQRLSEILAPVNEIKRKEIWCAMANHLPKLIKTPKDLAGWYRHFDSNYGDFVLEVLKRQGCLAYLLNSSASLQDALTDLNEEQCATLVFTISQNHLLNIINSSHVLSNLLCCLNDEQCSGVLRGLSSSSSLNVLIHSTQALSSALSNLNHVKCRMVLLAFKNQVHSIIKNSQDLSDVLQHLKQVQCRYVLSAVSIKLPNLIPTAEILCDILQGLDLDKRRDVLHIITSYLPNLIIDPLAMRRIFHFLDERQRIELFELVKEPMIGLISNANDLSNLLWYLNNELRSDVMTRIQSQIPLLKARTVDENGIVREDVKAFINHCFSGDIRSPDDLVPMLSSLNEDQCRTVFAEIKKGLPNLINHPYHVGYVFRSFNDAQYRAVLSVIQPDLPGTIKTHEHLLTVLRFLERPQCRDFLATIDYAHLSRLIKTPDVLISVLGELNDEQSQELVIAIKPRLKKLFSHADILGNVFRHLNTVQCDYVLDATREVLPRLIYSVHDLIDILFYLNDAQREEVLATVLPEQWAYFVKNETEFDKLRGIISPESFDQIKFAFISVATETKQLEVNIIENDAEESYASPRFGI